MLDFARKSDQLNTPRLLNFSAPSYHVEEARQVQKYLSRANPSPHNRNFLNFLQTTQKESDSDDEEDDD